MHNTHGHTMGTQPETQAWMSGQSDPVLHALHLDLVSNNIEDNGAQD